jgi:hypothetical protein
MPWVECERTISVFERAKAVYALDRSATVIGNFVSYRHYFYAYFRNKISTFEFEFYVDT